MVSTFTPNLALEVPNHGDYSSTGWDSPMDTSLGQLDTAYGGLLNLAVSGGVTTLTLAQASNPIIYITGTLSADQYVNFPPIAGRRLIIPALTLNGHVLYLRGNNGADTTGVYFWNAFGVPYGIVVLPWRLNWDYGAIGPGTVADTPSSFVGNGWLPADGRWVNMGLHDLLYEVYGGAWGSSGTFPTGSFKLPDLRGTVLAMADEVGMIPAAGPFAQDMGNRNILNGWGLFGGGTPYGGEANHQLVVGELPSGALTETMHAHGVIEPNGGQGHLHQIPNALIADQTQAGATPMGFGSGWGTLSPHTAYAPSGIILQPQYANVTWHGTDGAHNNIQPTYTTVKMIKW